MNAIHWRPDRPTAWQRLINWAQWNPIPIFIIAATLTYGTAAWVFAKGIFLLQPTQDIWQHLAAVRALMADPWNPQNPFVATAEGSRHFHPQWVAIALIGKALNMTPWQAIGVAGFINATVLSAGIHLFGRAFYRHTWGPFVLLCATVFSWTVPVHYTGFLSWTAISKGGGYPAMLLIGLSFLQWGLVIRATEGETKAALWLVPLTALMFATHQLGTVIGLVMSGSILLLWREGSLMQRLRVAVAIAAGLGLSSLWPYHNPFEAVLRTGNPTWIGSHDFFTIHYLIACLDPSALGLLGLWWTRGGTGRPLIVALAAYLIGFACVPFGVMIGERFLMPAVLVLQIGLGAVLIRWFSGPMRAWRKPLKIFAGAFAAVVLIQAANMALFTWDAFRLVARGETVAREADELTSDIPDNEEVAAYDVAAWPVVATGQKVLSIPWPEPMISDLEKRQELTNQLFKPQLYREQRVGLAREAGIRTLILDERYAWERRDHPRLVRQLESQSVAVRKRGPLIRFDLIPR